MLQTSSSIISKEDFFSAFFYITFRLNHPKIQRTLTCQKEKTKSVIFKKNSLQRKKCSGHYIYEMMLNLDHKKCAN